MKKVNSKLYRLALYLSIAGMANMLFLTPAMAVTEILNYSVNQYGSATWQGYDGTDYEIFYYDNATKTTSQLTTNSTNDFNPVISDGGTAAANSPLVAWVGVGTASGRNEVMVYDINGGATNQLSTNFGGGNGIYEASSPAINNLGDVVFAYSASASNSYAVIAEYRTAAAAWNQVSVATNTTGTSYTNPAISGRNVAGATGNCVVAWESNTTTGTAIGGANISGRETTVSAANLVANINITNGATNNAARGPKAAFDTAGANAYIVFTAKDNSTAADYEVFRVSNFTGAVANATRVTNNTYDDKNVAITSGSAGNFTMAWQGAVEGSGNYYDIFLGVITAAANNITQITSQTDSVHNAVNPTLRAAANEVAYQRHDGTNYQIYDYTLATGKTTQITSDALNHGKASMNLNGQIGYIGQTSSGSSYKPYQYSPYAQATGAGTNAAGDTGGANLAAGALINSDGTIYIASARNGVDATFTNYAFSSSGYATASGTIALAGANAYALTDYLVIEKTVGAGNASANSMGSISAAATNAAGGITINHNGPALAYGYRVFAGADRESFTQANTAGIREFFVTKTGGFTKLLK